MTNLLNKIDGIALGGRITAIMGPTGSGSFCLKINEKKNSYKINFVKKKKKKEKQLFWMFWATNFFSYFFFISSYKNVFFFLLISSAKRVKSKNSSLKGEILVNGKERGRNWKGICGYVMQDDVLLFSLSFHSFHFSFF